MQKPLDRSLVACEAVSNGVIFLLSPFPPLIAAFKRGSDAPSELLCMQQRRKGLPLADPKGCRSNIGLDGEAGSRGTLDVTFVPPCEAREVVSCSSAGYTEPKATARCF